MSNDWLVVKDLSVNLEGWQVLDGFNLTLKHREPVALLGPSGCGKTTFLRVLAGLVRPDRGEVWLEGKNLLNLPPEKRDFGLMFQDYALFPHMTVLENVAFPLRRRGCPKGEAVRLARPFLDRFDLGGQAGKWPAQLSGGQRQRVALARLLASSPRLLLLDEPFSAIDAELKNRLEGDLARVIAAAGGAIYVTHDLTEALAMAPARVALMDEGRLFALDSWPELWLRPPSFRAARFLGYNEISGLGLDPACRWVISPQAARPGPAGPEEIDLNLVVERGFCTIAGLTVSGRGPEGAELRFELPQAAPPRPGATVRLALPREALKSFPAGGQKGR